MEGLCGERGEGVTCLRRLKGPGPIHGNLRIRWSDSKPPLCKARRVKHICRWHMCSQSGERQRPGEVARERRRGCNTAIRSKFSIEILAKIATLQPLSQLR